MTIFIEERTISGRVDELIRELHIMNYLKDRAGIGITSLVQLQGILADGNKVSISIK